MHDVRLGYLALCLALGSPHHLLLWASHCFVIFLTVLSYLPTCGVRKNQMFLLFFFFPWISLAFHFYCYYPSWAGLECSSICFLCFWWTFPNVALFGRSVCPCSRQFPIRSSTFRLLQAFSVLNGPWWIIALFVAFSAFDFSLTHMCSTNIFFVASREGNTAFCLCCPFTHVS